MNKAGPCPRCQCNFVRKVPYTRDWSYPQCWRCLYSNYRLSANSECDSWDSFEGGSNQSTELTSSIKIRIILFDAHIEAIKIAKTDELEEHELKTISKLTSKAISKLDDKSLLRHI